ncbi:MAG: FIST C-terminal domain-containing protein [Candidatus Accumulibacter sp.]|jgi:small ligand-binding sensory domain FIST|nr:FIST C-terminal domain-containing protein [Accumulibacter sp.]
MKVGIGYSESPDTVTAGAQAVANARKQANRDDPCDFVLLFSTSRHDPTTLRDAVAASIGNGIPVIGGWAVGAITNDRFGYAGDQVILAVFWLEGMAYDAFVEEGLVGNEADVGKRLGQKLAQAGVERDTPIVLFYDFVDRSDGEFRTVHATPILEGITQELGFLPCLVGASLVGDYVNSAGWQWTGADVAQHSVIAIALDKRVRIDSVIMHGCRPGSGYYKVTKADRQTILEINGQPALPFINNFLNDAIPPDEYGFFLIFGVNKGGKWTPFDETNYASRLCLGVDVERNGIIMLDSDMVEGTEFQLMYRTPDLDYMPSSVERLWPQGRKPIFAFYINCAGRAAAYAGLDLEDAFVVQEIVADRVPLMGIYAGGEIAPVNGVPTSLSRTGVLCLFSVPQ